MKINKICKILMFCLLSIILFVTPLGFAEDSENDSVEYEYENFKYTIINENEIKITGLIDTTAKVENMVIPEKLNDMTVTEIGDRAFEGCTGLTGFLNLPKNLSVIGEKAFYGCTGVVGRLLIEENITEIGDYAFVNTNITKIEIKNDQGISYSAFNHFDLVVLGEEGTYAEEYSKHVGCYTFIDTTNVIYENEIGYRLDTENNKYILVDYKNSLSTELEIPESYKDIPIYRIGDAAFMGDAYLEKITIPSSIVIIGTGAFYKVDNFTTIRAYSKSFANWYADYEKYEFEEISGDTIFTFRTVDCYDYYEVIIAGLVDKDSAVENLEIPEKINGMIVTGIDSNAFENCFNIKGKVTLPDTIKYIGKYAFYGCNGITGEFKIPDKVEEIYDNTFYGCTGLEKIVWSDNVKKIGHHAFYNCTRLSGDLNLPEKLEKIDEYAFYGCKSLAGELKLPENLTEISREAFAKCSRIQSIVFNENLEEIGTYAFRDCSRVYGDILLPDSLTKVGTAVFENCIKIDGKVVIPPTMEEVPTSLFKGCKSIKEAVFTEGVKIIDAEAFSGCENLEKLTFPDSLELINYYGFSGCESLSGRIIIPPNMKEIGIGAFYGCKNVEEFVLHENVDGIGKYAFGGCSGWKGELVLPSSLMFVGEYAFSGCTGLNGNLNLPENIATIETGGFERTGLTGKLRLPESLIEIGENAFGNTFYYIIENGTKVKNIKLEDLLPTLNSDEYSIEVVREYNTLSEEDIVGSNCEIHIIDVLYEYSIANINIVIKGDINGDGKVRIYDAFQILKDVLVPGTKLTEIDIQIRDFNGDGNVRIYDAFQFLKQAILG